MARRRVKGQSRGEAEQRAADLTAVSIKTERKELFWLKGRPCELDIYRVPTKHLYFNIENGRYADKMIKLKADYAGVNIDPREEKWIDQIHKLLKGDVPGTESDRDPFGVLREDILAKQQLKPGVVLADGGVLDGNRRLAVLLDLQSTQRNPGRFQYFEGVILPDDVGAEDRWRVEAGLQIGRDEKLAYSPINQLLKIKEGLNLFKGLGDPAHEIAKTLYGMPESEIREDIQKIHLIDEYLGFIKKPLAYHLVSDTIERFEEAVAIVKSARRQQYKPDKLQKLKHSLFGIIRDRIMTNWEMRDIRGAMGAPGKGKPARLRNEKALADLIEIGSDTTKLRKALSEGNVTQKTSLEAAHKEKAVAFKDRMEAMKVASEPLKLASRAKTNLDTLTSALDSGGSGGEWAKTMPQLSTLLRDIKKLATDCLDKTRRLRK